MRLTKALSAVLKNLMLFSGCFFSVLLLGSAITLAKADTANLKLTLTIVTPPQCTINNGNDAMTVGFGEVQQGLIDGSSYKRMPINYGLSCSSVAKNALKMTLSWIPRTINGVATIQTSRSNLGIAIFRDNTPLSNGASLNFTYGSAQPTLYAVPVKPTGLMLTDAGAFTGAMTMTLDYQ